MGQYYRDGSEERGQGILCNATVGAQQKNDLRHEKCALCLFHTSDCLGCFLCLKKICFAC